MRPADEAVARPSGRAVPRSLVETIMMRAESGAGAPLLRFTDERGREESFDYARLREDALRAAGAMAEAGVAPGDRVLLLFAENHDMVRAFLGAIFLGALPAIHPPVGDAGRGVPASVRRLVEAHRFRLVQALPEDAEPIPAAALRWPRETDPAYIQLSSGTTGPPRGVVLSHGAIVRYAESAGRALDLRSDDTFVGWLPLFHDMGLITHVLVPTLTAVPSVHIATARWLRHPETLPQAVDRHRGTMTWMPNFAFAYCARRVRDEDLAGLDLSCWRSVGNGSEPIVPAVMEAFVERFAAAGFRREALVAGYGFAENVCGVTLTRPGRPPRVDRSGPRAVVSCGVPRPGVEVRVVDEAGRDLPDRAVGRILVRSTTLFDGYLDALEETRASFENGWFRSGDMGYVAEGELYVTGREKDLVIIGGRNVHPEAIEAAAAASPGFGSGRLVAFGVPDQTGATEAAVLVCETKNGHGEAEAARRALRDAVLAEVGVGLADVRFVPKGWIIRTTSGKTVRAACRRRYLDERAAAPPRDVGDLEDAVTELVGERLGARGVAPAGDLCAAADSLQLASLFLEIERLAGRVLPWDVFLREPTLAHLLRIVRAPADSAGTAVDRETPPIAAESPRRATRGRVGARMARAFPYGAIRRVLRRVAARPALRGRVLPHPLPLLLRFYALIDRPAIDEETYLQRACVARAGRRFRELAFSRRREGEIPSWVTVEGRSVLERALASGRGVLFLHSHYGAYEIAAWITAQLAGGPRLSVRGRDVREAGGAGPVLAARRHLAEGGTVHIAGDGTAGDSAPMEFPFHGRRRPFRIGFAYLAEGTDAAVIPVFSTIHDDGRVTVELREPLEGKGSDPRERIRARVRGYVTMLEDAWRKDPANVFPTAMRRHLAP
jgi:acyl-CoA synthetase (AMP-forming)/AMP-acid ligase II